MVASMGVSMDFEMVPASDEPLVASKVYGRDRRMVTSLVGQRVGWKVYKLVEKMAGRMVASMVVCWAARKVGNSVVEMESEMVWRMVVLKGASEAVERVVEMADAKASAMVVLLVGLWVLPMVAAMAVMTVT